MSSDQGMREIIQCIAKGKIGIIQSFSTRVHWYRFREKSYYQSRGREQKIDEQKVNIKTRFPFLMFLVYVIEIFAAN